jgi:hypothetical protein
MGSQSITFSPSKVTINRNTPCIDGCCGPIFITMGSVFVSKIAIFDLPILVKEGKYNLKK